MTRARDHSALTSKKSATRTLREFVAQVDGLELRLLRERLEPQLVGLTHPAAGHRKHLAVETHPVGDPQPFARSVQALVFVDRQCLTVGRDLIEGRRRTLCDQRRAHAPSRGRAVGARRARDPRDLLARQRATENSDRLDRAAPAAAEGERSRPPAEEVALGIRGVEDHLTVAPGDEPSRPVAPGDVGLAICRERTEIEIAFHPAAQGKPEAQVQAVTLLSEREVGHLTATQSDDRPRLR